MSDTLLVFIVSMIAFSFGASELATTRTRYRVLGGSMVGFAYLAAIGIHALLSQVLS